MTSWIDEELDGCEFRDVRLAKRFKKIITQLSKGIGKSIPLACQDWSSTKAAYRFFANGRVTESDIFSGHFQATKMRIAKTEGTILVLQDTTEFSFKKVIRVRSALPEKVTLNAGIIDGPSSFRSAVFFFTQ